MFKPVIAGFSRSPFTMARKGALIDSKPVNLLAEVIKDLDILIIRELTSGIYFGEPREKSTVSAFNTMIYSKDEIKRISETAEEEAQMELQMLLKQFEDWKKNNTGSFSDFMKDKSDPPVKEIKLANGGSVEDYADLIDAYTKGIDVLEGESLTEYINRIRAAEAKKND